MKQIYLILFIVFAGCSGRTSQPGDIPSNEYGNPGYIISFSPKRYVCYRTSEPIVLDGKADEDVWQMLPWNIEFTDIMGDHFQKPPYLTRAKMLWDDDYVYVAAELMEPHIRASGKMDDVIANNHFSVFFDANGNTHDYLEFVIDAAGSFQIRSHLYPGSDGTIWSDGKKAQVAAMEYVEGTINNPTNEDHYWSIEAAFPVKLITGDQLSIKPGAGVQWRMNFKRAHWNAVVVDGFYKKEIDSQSGKIYPQENWVWSPIGENNIHKPELWGLVQFSEIGAGGGRESFVYNTDEDVKWELRNILYAQQRFFDVKGRYAKRFTELRVVGFEPKALKFKPAMDSRHQRFIVKALSTTDEIIWYINHEGLIWEDHINDK